MPVAILIPLQEKEEQLSKPRPTGHGLVSCTSGRGDFHRKLPETEKRQPPADKEYREKGPNGRPKDLVTPKFSGQESDPNLWIGLVTAWIFSWPRARLP